MATITSSGGKARVVTPEAAQAALEKYIMDGGNAFFKYIRLTEDGEVEIKGFGHRKVVIKHNTNKDRVDVILC